VPGCVWRRGQRGFVLVLTLLMVSALCALLIEFSFRSRAGLCMADNGWRGAQALYCAEAGLQTALEVLRSSRDLDTDNEVKALFSGARTLEVGEGVVTLKVELESGRFNVNSVVSAAGKPVRRRIEQFLRLIDLINQGYGDESPVPYGLAPARVDWIDSDDDVTILPYVSRDNEGAESSYYASLERPHKCKNGPVDCLDELLLLKGMTPEFMDGRPADPEKGVEAAPGLRPLLTTHGETRININYAPAEVIQSLSPRIDAPLAAAIVAARQETKFASTKDLLRVPGVTLNLLREIEPLIAVGEAGRYYRVTARGQVGGASRVIEAVVERGSGGQGPRVAMRREL